MAEREPNSASGPSPMPNAMSNAHVEFRSRGAAVDVGQTCWVGGRAIVLAGHLLDSVVRNNEICRDRLIPDANKNTDKLDGWS